MSRKYNSQIHLGTRAALGTALHTPLESDPSGKTGLQAQGMASEPFGGLTRKTVLRGELSGFLRFLVPAVLSHQGGNGTVSVESQA